MSSKQNRGARLAEARQRAGMTQEGLARRCGCALRTIQRIEGNKVAAVSARVASAIYAQLGLVLSMFPTPKTRRPAARRP